MKDKEKIDETGLMLALIEYDIREATDTYSSGSLDTSVLRKYVNSKHKHNIVPNTKHITE